MKTTIIVPTKNRSKDLEKMLESVLTQSVCPDEIVIIDQSETDESEQLAHAVMKSGNGIHFNFVRDRAVRGAAQARSAARLGLWRWTRTGSLHDPPPAGRGPL